MPPVSPARISLPDRYKVVRHIANGGMAGVWEAQDELLGRAVAVKVLAQHLSDDDRARKRFEREARAAAGLSSHPNVVTIYDVAEHDGRAFMVMELMRGGSLADVLRRDEDISDKRSLRWLREAASGLDAAHEAGVVHRDVKPANLLLDDHDRLGIGDFGIARLAWEEQVTQTGQVLGTAAYLAPEQAMGEPATAASDRYALSVVAFELLTGEKPFNAEHFAAQARAHVEDDPPRASELNPDLTDRVDAVIDRGMAKDPDDRWGSAAEFVERLDEALAAPPPRRAAKPVAAAPTRSTRLLDGRDGTPPPTAPVRRAPTSDRPGRSGPGAGVLIGGLVALAAVVIAFILLTGDGNGNGDKGGQTAAKKTATPAAKKTASPSPTAEKTSTPTPTRTATPTATATATATPTPTAQQPAGNEPSGTNPAQLQLQAYNLNRAGKPAQALPVAQKAVRLGCKGNAPVSPCGYALFELAKAQRGTGDAQGAVKTLEQRLQRYPDDQRAAVEAELKKARAAAKG
jgi:eukaryotic-like serine/threonine-protein kinase